MGFLALTNGNVLTGVPDEGGAAGALLIRGGRVEGLYTSLKQAEEATGGAVQTIDLAGMTLLPGMIDCHVHLFLSGAVDSVTNRDFAIGRAAERAAQHLHAGVTTIRDLGAPVPEIFELRDQIAAQNVPGPRVVAAGGIMTIPEGHGWFMGTQVPTGSELVNAIKDEAARGADCIKIAVSGGVSTEGSDLFAVQFAEDDLRAGVETAHSLGLHVAAHASNPEAVRLCALTGVDSVEHAIMIDDAALEALVQGRTILVPTLTATDKPPEMLEDRRIPRFVREKGKITVPAHRTSIARAIAAGVTMGGGTDAGSTMTRHGEAAHEADQLVKCGLSPEQALAAVTRNAASLMGLSDRLGTLEPGKIADAIVVGGNPLDDITYLKDVRLVIKDGGIVYRGEGSHVDPMRPGVP